jgi:hypothetical protein
MPSKWRYRLVLLLDFMGFEDEDEDEWGTSSRITHHVSRIT